MRVAFLFVEKYPNYSLALEVLHRLTPEEMQDIDTYVRAGVWGFDDLFRGNKAASIQQREHLAVQVIMTQQGNIWGLNNPQNEPWHRLATETIYVVQFNSIRRSLAFMLHQRLVDVEEYLGFTQVLPHTVREHQKVFNFLPYLFKIERGRIFVLFSSKQQDAESLADEVLKWVRTHYRSLLSVPFVQAFSKRDIGARFSIFDATDHPRKELNVHQALQILKDEWDVQSEQVIYRALDVAPAAVEELLSGVLILSKPFLSSADCAQMAVNFRRCLEKLAEAITPPLSNDEKKECLQKRKGEYKFRLEKYVATRLAGTEPYRDYLQSELEELSTRIEKLYNLGNKGIHEDWLYHAFSLLSLRLALLMNDLLLPRRLIKPSVFYEPVVFEDEQSVSEVL